MSNNIETSKKIARILRMLATKLEDNPDFLNDIELHFGETPNFRKKKVAPTPIDFDVFEIYAQGGEKALQQKLEHLDISTLKRVISTHGFDPSKLAEKWRNKERLLNLILDRVAARSDKGKTFKEYS